MEDLKDRIRAFDEFCTRYGLHFYRLQGRKHIYAIHYMHYKLTTNIETGFTIVTSPTDPKCHISFDFMQSALNFIDFEF